VPIDKFRYPWGDKMVDLVVLVQNKHVTFENLRWQKVQCNLDWLERDWPLPTQAEAASVPAADAILKPTALPTGSPRVEPVPPPAPATPKTLPDTSEMILSVLGLKGFQQEAIAKAVVEHKLDLPEDLKPADLRDTVCRLQKDKAQARGDKLPNPPGW